MPSIRDKIDGQITKLAKQTENLMNHPISRNDDQEGNFFNIDVSLIVLDPDQPRKYFDPDALFELSESIKEKGILQPLLIRKDGDGQIRLVVGERCYRAALMAGLDRIPAILTKGNPHEIALIENLQRQDLMPMEEAEALERLAFEHRYTHETLSKAIGKARSTVTEILSLNRLPESIKIECRSSKEVPRRLLVEIAKGQNEDEMIRLFEKAKKEQVKSDRLRSIRKGQSEQIKKSHDVTITKKIQQLSLSLRKLDLTGIDDPERQALTDALTGLKEILVETLDHVGAPTDSTRKSGLESFNS